MNPRLALAGVALLGAGSTVVGIALAPDRNAVPTVDRSSLTPAAATELYYASLAHGDYATAFGLLCDPARTQGQASYVTQAGAAAQVQSWRTQSTATQGDRSGVIGFVTLVGGRPMRIGIVLERDREGWGVCSSTAASVNAPGAGILPPPADGSGGTGGDTGPATTGSVSI